MQSSFQTIKTQITQKWSCLSYARDILGLPVSHDGDRCTSLAPGTHTHSDAFQVFTDSWRDFTWGKSGDVIDLCAWARHNGDIGEALRELGPEFLTHRPEIYGRVQDNFERRIDTWHKALRPQDREYLHDRRITDETIDRLKIGYNEYTQRIIFPYWHNGKPVYYSARDATGQWKTVKNYAKYKKCFTSDYIQNTIWGLDSLSPDFCGDIEHDEEAAYRNKFLLILEGQVDALSAYQEKWHVISPVCGRFGQKLMPWVKNIAGQFETVVVIFDNDTRGDMFRFDMARFLFSNNIKFICGHTEHPRDPGAKFDVSDYYTEYGTITPLIKNATEGIVDLAQSFRPGMEEAFEKFMMDAGRWVSPAGLERLRKYIPLDKHYVTTCIKQAQRGALEREIADKLLKEHELVYVPGDSFYEYEHGVWNAKHEMFIQRYARDLIGKRANTGQMAGVAKHAAIVCASDKTFNGDYIINLSNGILSLPTTRGCASWDDVKVLEHSPSYMTTIQLKIAFDRKARNLRFEKFISEIMKGDKAKMRYLRQVLGYSAFYPGNPEQLGFMFMGDGANGKSVLIEVIRRVLDPRNCSDVELSNMADRFEPYALRHSLINFCTETNVNVKGAEAAIKKVVSCDPIRASKKCVDAVTFKPRCKLICACNSYINSKDLTHAFLRRWSFIKFERTFSEAEANRNLINELCEDLPGILNWLIEGYLDYMQNGLLRTAEDAETKEEFIQQYNPIATFLKYGLDNMGGKCLTAADLYHMHYVPWCEKAHAGVIQMSTFFNLVRKMMERLRPDVEIARLHGYYAYRFPDSMPDMPTAEEIFAANEDRKNFADETPEAVKEPETVKESPAMTAQSAEDARIAVYLGDFAPAGGTVRNPAGEMTNEQIAHCKKVRESVERFKPDICGIRGAKDIPAGIKDEYGVILRDYVQKWEVLMSKLYRAGLPHTLRHAIMYHELADGCGGCFLDGAVDVSDEIIRWVKEKLVIRE